MWTCFQIKENTVRRILEEMYFAVSWLTACLHNAKLVIAQSDKFRSDRE